MKRLLTIVLLILAIPSFADEKHDARLARADRRADAKIMSFNIRVGADGLDGDNCWANRANACVDMLKETAPDIVGFQECKPIQVDFLKASLPEYGCVDINRAADSSKVFLSNSDSESLMILYLKSRYTLDDSGFFWLSETPEVSSKGWDADCLRVVPWVKLIDREEGYAIYYFNAHVDHKGKVAQAESCKMLVEKMEEIAGKKDAIVLCGDFNMTPENTAFEPILDWMGNARKKTKLTDAEPTFTCFADRNIDLDYIFYRKLRVIGYETIADSQKYGVPFLSDHNAVCAYFKF